MTYKNTKDHHTERKREMCACVHTHTHTHTHTQTHTQLFAREQRGPINSRTGAVEIFNSCEQHPKGRRDSYLGTVECSVMTFCLSFFFVRFFCRPVCVIHELCLWLSVSLALSLPQMKRLTMAGLVSHTSSTVCEWHTIAGPKLQNFQCPRHCGGAAIPSEFLSLHKHACGRAHRERKRKKKTPLLPLSLVLTHGPTRVYTRIPVQVSLGNNQHQTVDQGEALFFEMDSVLTTLRLEVGTHAHM
jgi:hypothetical protein